MVKIEGLGRVYTFRQAIDLLFDKLKFDHRFDGCFDYEIKKYDETDENFVFAIARPTWTNRYYEHYIVRKANGEVIRA